MNRKELFEQREKKYNEQASARTNQLRRKNIYELIDSGESFPEYVKFFAPVLLVAICYGYISWSEQSLVYMGVLVVVFMGLDANRKFANYRLKKVIDIVLDEVESADCSLTKKM